MKRSGSFGALVLGVSVVFLETSLAETRYVSLSGGHVPPFTNWATAATNIQAAIDVASDGDTILVTNGVYATGGQVVYGAMSNRVAITKPVTVRSVNGPAVTVIRGTGPIGDSAVRCVYVGTNAVLSDFTLTNGATRSSGEDGESSGGGAWCEISGMLSNCVLTGNSASWEGGGSFGGMLNNCTLTGNSAFRGGGSGNVGKLNNCILANNSASFDGGGSSGRSSDATLNNCVLSGNTALDPGYGGGASDCTLNNCMLTSNSASNYGGGTMTCTLNNCMLIGNSAPYGGGSAGGMLNNCTLTGNSAFAYGGGSFLGTLNNCIVYYNDAARDPNIHRSTFNYSCTISDPDGTGNITNEPMFVNRAASNLRLLSNSPCINAGTNQDWMVGALDLDGNPRIYGGGRVDMGAYEYQGSLSIIPTNWLARYGLPIDGSEDHGHADGDGMDNWQEWRCKTDPTNETSFLHFMTSDSNETEIVVHWQSAEGVQYQLKRSTNLCTDAFSYLVRTNIAAVPPMNTEMDTTAVGSGPWFYRVSVE